jgi:hypothetical protein
VKLELEFNRNSIVVDTRPLRIDQKVRVQENWDVVNHVLKYSNSRRPINIYYS